MYVTINTIYVLYKFREYYEVANFSLMEKMNVFEIMIYIGTLNTNSYTYTPIAKIFKK